MEFWKKKQSYYRRCNIALYLCLIGCIILIMFGRYIIGSIMFLVVVHLIQTMSKKKNRYDILVYKYNNLMSYWKEFNSTRASELLLTNIPEAVFKEFEQNLLDTSIGYRFENSVVHLKRLN